MFMPEKLPVPRAGETTEAWRQRLDMIGQVLFYVWRQAYEAGDPAAVDLYLDDLETDIQIAVDEDNHQRADLPFLPVEVADAIVQSLDFDMRLTDVRLNRGDRTQVHDYLAQMVSDLRSDYLNPDQPAAS